MKISLVMCTYNGEYYIHDQLESIYEQSLSADEVIIQDDCSTDNTVEVIKQFVSEKGLANWIVLVNEKNIGWKANFISVINKASGDLIFLSDQDDIWSKNKIRIMTEIYSNNPDMELLTCRHTSVDVLTGKNVKIYQPRYGNKDVTKVNLSRAFAQCGRPGCTYAVSGRIKELITENWREGWPHDLFIWCLCMARGTLYSYNKPLVEFRRHQGTNSPSNEKNSLNRSEIMHISAAIGEELLHDSAGLSIPAENQKVIRKATKVYLNRADAIKKKSILKALFLIRYFRYYPRLKAWVGDVVSAMR